MTELVTTQTEVMNFASIAMIRSVVDLVLDALHSDRTRKEYKRALDDFMQWYMAIYPCQIPATSLNRAAIQSHVTWLRAKGVTDSSINQRLAALRKLSKEAAANGLLTNDSAHGIQSIDNIPVKGTRQGNWLTRSQAEAMIKAPDTETMKGKRDRAVLSVMLGAGLRREEVVSLAADHFQQREGRWVILNLKGKHNRTRTIPIAAWVKLAVDNWMYAASIKTGPIFLAVRKGGEVQPRQMSSQAVWNIVKEYSPVSDLSPHDLRRTFAKLADKAGAPLAQIQINLGHASVQTTEKYIGTDLDYSQSPSDMLQLDLSDD